MTFAAPPMNLYDEVLHRELRETVEHTSRDPRVRAVLFRAEGPVFTGGVDVAFLQRLGGSEGAAQLFTEMLEMIRALEELTVPTVLAAHATCLTWGFELALACDLIVAADGVRFGMVEPRFALTPAMGGTQRLAARAGLGRAREMVLTGALYRAETLAAWNVVNDVLPADGFSASAERYTGAVAALPTHSHRAAKAILRAFAVDGVAAADDVTPKVAASLLDTAEHAQLIKAFLAGREPKATSA